MSERGAPSPSSTRFQLPGAHAHYAADRPVRAEHVRLDVQLDFEAQALQGECATRVRAVREVTRVVFDAVDLEVRRVEIDRAPTPFVASGGKLTVTLPAPLAAGQAVEITVHYGARPSRGLYFIGPDNAYPDRPRQAWTQGQDEDARAWFPCLDAPAQKATTDLTARFPAEFIALSNGRLVEDRTEGALRSMRYRLDAPHAPYLVTLVVGDFELLTEEAHGVTFKTFHPPGRGDDALRCVRRTPEMLAKFEALTGEKYPYGSYAQAFVAEFIFGGMENTSATTLTDTALYDARAALDYTTEPLVAHELAHQWFGDLLTCRDWPHGWLNEGFATYFEVLWKEHAEGQDEADQMRREELDDYLEEAGSHYARPIVERSFHEPIELFDRHLYQKGGLVLHALRMELGDRLFFEALRHYVHKHRHGAVETTDWARAIEESTGHNVDRFLDGYVHRAGHPELKVEVRFEAPEHRLRIKVQQGPGGDDAFAYQLTLPIRVRTSGKDIPLRLAVTEREHVFFIPVDVAPTQVTIDPRRELLATLEVDKPVELWREELKAAPEARARTEAALALGKEGTRISVDALGAALLSEAFWGTQAACARALARTRAPRAKKALLHGLGVSHPKARRAVVAALGDFRGDLEVGEAIRRRLSTGDASYFVEGELARSLGRLRLTGDIPHLVEALKRPAFADTIAVGAIDGLAASAAPEAFPLLLGLLPYGQPVYRRRAATSGLVRLAEQLGKKTEAADALAPLLRDLQFRVQTAAIDAAQRLGERRLAGPLEEIPFQDGRMRRAAREAVRALREGGGVSRELVSLRDEVDRLKGETRQLKETVEALKPVDKAPAKKGSPRATRKRRAR